MCAVGEGLWNEGEREFYYDLPTDDPVTGYVDTCSMFIDLNRRRLRQVQLNRYVKTDVHLIVTHLHLQFNKLTELPDAIFVLLRNLLYLDARNNDLISFSTSVKEHDGLQTILLQDNLLEELPIELGSVEGLKTLGIEYNPLKFPSYAVRKQWRNKKDVVDYFKRCWKQKSMNVDAVVVKRKKLSRRIEKPKYFAFKDVSEIVYDLKRSNNLKDHKLGDRIKSQVQERIKTLQKCKDKDALNKWRHQYKAYQTVDRSVSIDPPPYGIEIHNKVNEAKRKAAGYRLNLEEEIVEIKNKLKAIGNETVFKDPDREMEARAREMRAIRKLQKKIEYLKYRS